MNSATEANAIARRESVGRASGSCRQAGGAAPIRARPVRDHAPAGTTVAIRAEVVIRFVSTLTRHEEEATADALMDAVARLLDLLPIGYSLSIESSTGERRVHSRPCQSGTAVRKDPGPTSQLS